MKMPDVIPLSWKIGAAVALVAALGAGHAWRVNAAFDKGHSAAVAERAAADLVAVVGRVHDNAIVEMKQRSINEILTKAKDAEIAPVIKRIYVDRVRVGPSICNGPATPAQAASAASSNSADSLGRLVPQRTEDDLRALTEAVERDLSTGRACQAFIKANGMVP